jgi:hypothetical protein
VAAASAAAACAAAVAAAVLAAADSAPLDHTAQPVKTSPLQVSGSTVADAAGNWQRGEGAAAAAAGGPVAARQSFFTFCFFVIKGLYTTRFALMASYAEEPAIEAGNRRPPE